MCPTTTPPSKAGHSASAAMLVAMLATSPLLSACTPDRAPDDLFPLQTGLRWEYQMETDLRERTLTRRFHIAHLGETTLKQETAQTRQTSDGTDYYLTRRQDGIYRIGKRTVIEREAQADSPARLALPLPAQLGKTWGNLTQSYTLHRVMPNIEPPERSTMHFHMNYEVAATDETVSVPAGTFAHCVRVDGLANVSLYADAKIGLHHFDITSREWYAPRVGLVKMERLEPLDAEVFKGGKVTLELVAWD